MPYSRLKVVYGVSLLWQHESLIDKKNFKEYEYINTLFNKIKPKGLLKYDSAQNSSYTFVFGIEKQEMSSYNHHVNINSLEVTEEMKQQWLNNFNQLDERMKKIVESFGSPHLCMIWDSHPLEKEKNQRDIEFKKAMYPFKL